MNKITIIGNLTADPELRSTPDGKSVCNFNVAVSRKRRTEGQPEADFFRVSAWNAQGEICAKYLTKGKKVCVIGSVSCHAYESNGQPRASIDILCQEVEFLSGREKTDKETGYSIVNNEEVPY